MFQALKTAGALGQDQREGRFWEEATSLSLPGQTNKASGLRGLKAAGLGGGVQREEG